MGNIRIRVAAIVELLDRMTGAPVKKGQAWIEPPSGQKMIEKENGCFAFLHPLTDKLKVMVKSQIFRPFDLELLVEEDGLRHLHIWLEPNREYLYPPETTFIEGTWKALKKNEHIVVIPTKESRGIRLSADYEKGEDRISMYGINEKVEERKYILWQDEAPVSEVFTIKANGECAGEYMLEKPLGKNYRKGEVQVRNVYETDLNEEKCFYVALRNIEQDTKAVFLVDGKVKKTLDIVAGKVNVL